MKILLINIHRPVDALAGYYKTNFAPMPPLNLAYLAAVLEQAGIDVAVHDDALAGGGNHDLRAALERHRPEVVGLSYLTAVMPEAPRVVRLVRSVDPAIRIVAGNLHADVFYESILSGGLADIVVHGEAEETLVELLRTLADSNGDLANVAGISFVRENTVHTTPPRPRIADLDRLPFPAWHLFERERYRLFNFARVRSPGMLTLGSRGCPFGCTYCSLKVMGHRRRCRSAASIADECEWLYDRYGYVQPSFVDPIFPFDKAEGLAYADELIRRGLHRRQVWVTETRTDLVDFELLEALRESGLRRIMFGFETGEQSELTALRKGTRVDSALRAVQASRRAGVEVIGFFMLGVPGSTRRSLQTTIDHALGLDIDFAKFTVFAPFPGTAVYEELLAQGALEDPTDWQRYTSYPTQNNPPIYVPEELTAEDLIRFQRRAHRSFYLRPSMAYRQLFRIRTLTLSEIAGGLKALLLPRAS